MNGTTPLFKNRCERCGLRAWDDLYSDDGLPGHEILICSSCRREIEGARKQLAWMEKMEAIEREVFPDSHPRSEVVVEVEDV